MIVRDLPRVIEHLDGDQVGLLCDTVLGACGGTTVEAIEQKSRRLCTRVYSRAVGSVTMAIGGLKKYISLGSGTEFKMVTYRVATEGGAPASTPAEVNLVELQSDLHIQPDMRRRNSRGRC